MPLLADYLTRVETARELTLAGYPYTNGRLAQLQHQRLGPPVAEQRGTRRLCYYQWSAALGWAQTQPILPTVIPTGWLTRRETAVYLTAEGYKISASSLSIAPVYGGGPAFSLIRVPSTAKARAYYCPVGALTWAKQHKKKKNHEEVDNETNPNPTDQRA